jgi:preprotein translocase subunit SecG
MTTFLTISHVVICLVLIGVVLLQSGREGGGDIGGGGGGGAKPIQSGNKFMERLTSTMAVVFMITSIVLAAQGAGTSVMGDDKKKAEAVGVVAPAEGTAKEVKLDEAAPGTEPSAADEAATAESEAKDKAEE